MKRILFIAATLAAVAAGAETYWYAPAERVQGGQWTWIEDGEGWRQIYLAPFDISGEIESQIDSSWWYKPDKSGVNGFPVDIKSKDGVKFGTINVLPTDSEQTIANKIKVSGIPDSAAGAYAVAVVALAKSLYNELQSKRFEEYFSTLSKSLQAQIIGSLATTYDEVNVQGGKIRIVNDSLLSKIDSVSDSVSKLKTLRDNFLTSPETGQSGTMSIDKQKLVVQGIVSVGGGGGGSSPTDAMSVTNLKYTVVDDKKEVEKSVTTLAGWWQDYGKDGGINRENVDAGFLCDFELSDLAKPADDKSRDELNKHYMLTRTGDGQMHYLKMDKQLKSVIDADDMSITTNTEYGAVKSGTLSLANWGTPAAMDFSKWLLMSEEQRKDLGEYGKFDADVVIRQRYSEDDYSQTNLLYYSSGSLYEMSWSTNWNEAAKDIAKKEAEKVVNWNTNWVRLADNIASSQSKMKEYVDNSLNWSTNFFASTADLNGSQTRIRDYIDGQVGMMTNTLSAIRGVIGDIDGVDSIADYLREYYAIQTNLVKKVKKIEGYTPEVFVNNITNFYTTVLNEITNWNIITNVFITYLGGKSDAGGGGGGGGVDAPLELPTTKDPYKEDFVKEEKTFDYLLPVKNGWMISHMTNDLWGIVNAEHALDNMSLFTNEARRAEIQGYKEAETNKMPVKVKLEQPKTDRDGNPILYGIEWMDYPTALMEITSKDIDKIKEWLKVTNKENIFTLVASNTEKVAMLQTAPYNVINANTLLDNASIWTNDNFLAEVKGFQHAPYGTVPVKSSMGAVADELKWLHPATPDSEVMADVGQGDIGSYYRSLVRQDGYGVLGASNVWSLCGFDLANEGEVPSAHTDEFGNKELKWGLTGNAVRVVGTDGSEAVVGVAAKTNTLTFASAGDSNVKATVAGDGNGNVTVTLGVYYLQESNLNGGGGGGSGL